MSDGDRPPSIFAVVCLAVLGHTAFAAGRMTVALAAIHLKVPTYEVGVLLSLYALVPMLVSVSAGRWVDRIGTRVPMIAGASVVTVGYALPALWHTVAALYAHSLLVGVGFLVFHLSVQKLTGDLADGPARLRNFSLLAVGFSISGFSGPIIAGFVIDHAGAGASFGLSFAAAGALTLCAVALLGWRWTFSGRTHAEPAHLPGRRRVMDLLATPVMKRLFITVVMISTAWDVQAFLIPVHGSRIGLSASRIGLVLGAFAAATFVVRVALPLVTRRLNEWQLLGSVQAIAAAVYLVFPFFSNEYALMALAFALGLGLGAGQPTIMALLHRESPPGRVGEAVGLRMTMINATQTVLPTTFGSAGTLLAAWLPAGLAFASLFWGVSLLAGISSVAALRAPPPSHSRA